MKLTDLAKKIISEDATGNFPASGGGMSPGRSPTNVSPPATPNAKTVDIIGSYNDFKTRLENQEGLVVKKFAEELKKQFLTKHVSVKASKGSIGQIEKEYGIIVNNIDVRYIKNKYYIVFIGKEEKDSENEYYLNDSSIQVDSSAQPVSDTGASGGLSATSQTAGGSTKRNIIPQT